MSDILKDAKVFAAALYGITETRPDLPPAERHKLADAAAREMIARGLVAGNASDVPEIDEADA